MKTAMQEFSEWIKAYEYEIPLELQIKAKEMLKLEELQLCEMYIKGREDNHLDYYPEKHAKETYNELFKNTQ